VILNEFTDTGLDALTLASAAHGYYDVRMIPGGCLCCTGEQDFKRQLSSLLTADKLPARILIEPSGIGHPGLIAEELRVFERSGAITLCSTVALIEPQQAAQANKLSGIARDQIDAADVVILSKAELADASARSHFHEWADDLFPAKRFIGLSERGELPVPALSPPVVGNKFSFARTSNSHTHTHESGVTSRDILLRGVAVASSTHHYLNREGCGWIVPPEVIFDLERFQRGLVNAAQLFGEVERLKAALRTGIDRWHLLQRWNDQFELREIAWRNDSRVEVQIQEGISTNWTAWDAWIASTISNPGHDS